MNSIPQQLYSVNTPTLTRQQIEGLPHYKLAHRAKNEYSAACPFCDSDHDGFRFWPDDGNYWCRKCGAKGWVDEPVQLSFEEYLAKQQAMALREAEQRQQIEEKRKSLPSRAEYYHSMVDDAREYWHAEGIDDTSIEKFQLGYDPNFYAGKSYTIPYMEEDTVVNLRHRLDDDSQGRYRPEFAGLGMNLFNPDTLTKPSKMNPPNTAVIVEGEKKAIVLDQVGFRAVGVPGVEAWDSDWAIKYFRRIDKVYIVADPGAGEKWREIALQFQNRGKWAVLIELPEKPDDMLKYLSNAEFMYLIQKGQDFVNPRAQRVIQAKLQVLFEAEQRKGKKNTNPTQLEQDRMVFTSAAEWRDYVREYYPELDPDSQYHIKLEENKEWRKENVCGHPTFELQPDGSVSIGHWRCGVCDKCLREQAELLKQFITDYTGDTDLVLISASSRDRAKWGRRLRDWGLDHNIIPTEDGVEIITTWSYEAQMYVEKNDLDITFIDRMLLSINQCLHWVKKRPGTRRHYGLTGPFDELWKHFIVKSSYETDPDNPDAAELQLTTIICDGIRSINPPTCDKEIESIEDLQEALDCVADTYVQKLTNLGYVVLGVYKNSIYIDTSKTTLDRVLEKFNSRRNQWQMTKTNSRICLTGS